MDLRVFEIRVSNRDRTLVDLVVMLSTDADTACKQTGYDPKIYTLIPLEIEGPFKSGTILSDWC